MIANMVTTVAMTETGSNSKPEITFPEGDSSPFETALVSAL
jgi:hypothetical protein